MKVVGLDLGTSNIKAVRFDLGKDAVVEDIVSMAHPLRVPHPDHAEQDPDLATEITREVLQKLDLRNVQAIAVSGAMHSLLPLDAKGAPLTHAWTWADLRSAPQARELQASDPTLPERSGTPVHPMAWPAKLRWLQQESPALEKATRRFTGLKEYVLEQLTGVQGLMDRGMASGTGCYNLRMGTWEADEARFPRIVETDSVWGHYQSIPIIAGGGDGPLSNLGSGAVDDTLAALSLGTSGAIRVLQKGASGDPLGRTFCYHLVDDWWVRGGAISNGTVTLDWIAALTGFAGDNVELVKLAWSEAAAEHGLLVLPYLAGERAPHWNPDARAVFLGLSLHHRPHHLVRALLESIAFALKDVLQALGPLPNLQMIRASGGLTQSPQWMALLADVLEVPVCTIVSPEAGALGAALLASKTQPTLPIQAVYRPRPSATLQATFARYQALYGAVKGFF